MVCWLRLLAVLLAFGMGSPGANANEPGLSATEVVRRYSRTVACQIHEAGPGYRQYAAVTLRPEVPDGISGVWLVGRLWMSESTPPGTTPSQWTRVERLAISSGRRCS